ncbi:MAG: hypothetical protein RL094_554 [Candidatus Parcubacteria bacterium]|jgi:hypothetical protein
MSIQTPHIYKEGYVHPEETEHERFFTNTNDVGFHRLPWQSKRRGQRTFDGKGREFFVDNWFPVFISRDELQESSISLLDARRAFVSMTDSFMKPGVHAFQKK